MRFVPSLIAAALTATVLAALPIVATAATAPLVSNAVVVDNASFYAIDGADTIGSGNYALNYPGFIDIPYAIFDFGGTTSVSNATLSWNYDHPFGGSGPAQITLYVGHDADGAITTADRFVGTAVNTFTVAGGEVLNFNVTGAVNAALASGQYVAARLEATVPPTALGDYYGGNFVTPTMTYTAGVVPEVDAAVMVLCGMGVLGGLLARRRKAA